MKEQNKGFTLIELLVVIAIIGILASVVLASLNTARDKGADASIMATLNNMRAQAELVYYEASPNSYAAVCSDVNIVQAMEGANELGGASADCGNNTNAWAIEKELKSDGYYCVDSTGAAETTTNTAAITDTSPACDGT